MDINNQKTPSVFPNAILEQYDVWYWTLRGRTFYIQSQGHAHAQVGQGCQVSSLPRGSTATC